jgi:phosphopantothenoylcysteine decarboxylase/phosphopantothenate--cysteine ligase
LKDTFQQKAEHLKGKRVLINAGPTRENIDPVRFISNHSTGKMGIALADAACKIGADVTLVLGPVSLKPESEKINVVNVISAESMANECLSRFKDCDIAILSAAVADYTPRKVSPVKIKKGMGELVIRLKPTTDIASRMGRVKRKGQILVGFALETDNEIENAVRKLKTKNLDMIVLNSLRDEGAGFGHDTNLITIIDRNNNIDKFELKSKEEVASDILKKIILLID